MTLEDIEKKIAALRLDSCRVLTAPSGTATGRWMRGWIPVCRYP